MAAADIAMAERLGVSSRVIATLREELTKGLHFNQEPGGALHYTDEGAMAICAALGLKKKEGAAAPPAPEAIPLSIVRIFPSPIWVRITTPDGQAADIRVRDNRRLSVRMRLLCIQDTQGRWLCTEPAQLARS